MRLREKQIKQSSLRNLLRRSLLKKTLQALHSLVLTKSAKTDIFLTQIAT